MFLNESLRYYKSQWVFKNPLSIFYDDTVACSLKVLGVISLYLPMTKEYYPAVDNFLWHLGERFGLQNLINSTLKYK